MKAILESVAARAANGWQRAGAKFDFEVLAMPGGSVIAPALWVYAMAISALKRPEPRSLEPQSPDAQSAPEASIAARAPGANPRVPAAGTSHGLRCCHCT